MPLHVQGESDLASVKRSRPGRPRSSSKRSEDAQEVVNSLRRLFKGIHEYSKAVQRQAGLSSPQLWALTLLDREPGLSLGELAERMFAHVSTVSGIVDRLDARGVVVRAVDPEDRRGIKLSLTRRGRRVLRRSPPPVQAGLREALEAMSPRRLHALRVSLEAISLRTSTRSIKAPFFDVEP
jgi:DNA-binding MarR family transcriptional regulator